MTDLLLAEEVFLIGHDDESGKNKAHGGDDGRHDRGHELMSRTRRRLRSRDDTATEG